MGQGGTLHPKKKAVGGVSWNNRLKQFLKTAVCGCMHACCRRRYYKRRRLITTNNILYYFRLSATACMYDCWATLTLLRLGATDGSQLMTSDDCLLMEFEYDCAPLLMFAMIYPGRFAQQC